MIYSHPKHAQKLRRGRWTRRFFRDCVNWLGLLSAMGFTVFLASLVWNYVPRLYDNSAYISLPRTGRILIEGRCDPSLQEVGLVVIRVLEINAKMVATCSEVMEIPRHGPR